MINLDDDCKHSRLQSVRLDSRQILEVTVANSFFDRFKGLLMHSSLPEGTGLVLEKCNSIHTIGMKFPIDVVFLDAGKKVLSVKSNMKSWKMAYCPGATRVIECNAGVASDKGIVKGEVLSW